MKNIYPLLVLFIISTSAINAQFYQSGSVTTKENKTSEGRIYIDNTSKNVVLKKSGESFTYNLNSISSVVKGSRNYTIINFDNTSFLGYQLEDGKVSFFDLSNSDYLILKEDGSGKVINLEGDKNQIPGILSVLFNDCSSVRDAINSNEYFDEKGIKNLVSLYNNCNYGAYTLTEKELARANNFNTDSLRFYGGFISSFNNSTINNLGSNNTTGFGLGLGVSASPSFMGNLQGNLFIDFDFSMTFTGDNDFDHTTNLNYSNNTYRLSIGLEYLFNKNGVIQPFLGIGGGYSSDYYKGNIGSISFKDNGQNVYFVPKIGLLYQLKNNNHIGLTVSYIPEYDNDLSFLVNNEFDEIELRPFVINNSAITLGLNYYF